MIIASQFNYIVSVLARFLIIMEKTLKLFAVEFLSLLVLFILIPAVIYLDSVVLKNGLGEVSFAEITQSLLLIVSATILISLSRKNEPEGILFLSGSFLIMLFIREQDHYFDYVYHGFWKVPFLIFFVLILLFKFRLSVFDGLEKIYLSRGFSYVFLGVVILIVFSRVFGSGLIWKAIMGEDYMHEYKTIIQEGLELFAYSMIFYGCLLFYFSQKTDFFNISVGD